MICELLIDIDHMRHNVCIHSRERYGMDTAGLNAKPARRWTIMEKMVCPCLVFGPRAAESLHVGELPLSNHIFDVDLNKIGGAGEQPPDRQKSPVAVTAIEAARHSGFIFKKPDEGLLGMTYQWKKVMKVVIH